MSSLPLNVKILGLDHVALVPKDRDKCLHFFEKILGFKSPYFEIVASEKVELDLFSFEKPENHSNLEILKATDPESTIAHFLTKKGGGLHHIALRVENLLAWIAHLKAHQIRLINETPKKGHGGKNIVFIHPESSGGILVELVEISS